MSELPAPIDAPPPRRAADPERPSVERIAVAVPARSALEAASSAQRHELVGQTLGGRYRIHGILGQGGMGTVYDAEHLGLSREVAVKVLSPSQAKKRVAVKRFQQEARAAGAIGHPNICEVYDLGVLDDGSPYLVMEKLVGQTLADRIAKEGGLPFEDVVETVSQVLSGLVAAHEKGIVHRDIKPENIFLARRLGCPPIIKLLDFGVSKMMPEFQTGDDAFDLTRTGMVMGTPYYMSPEQARGERNLDGRVDVYACGVVMYEALAGKRPFVGANYNALLLSIINIDPRPLRELRPSTPPELAAMIDHAMAKNRADRYPSAKHFLNDLVPQRPSRSPRPAAPMAHAPGADLRHASTRDDPPARGARPSVRPQERADLPPDRGTAPMHPSSRRAVPEELASVDIPIVVDEDEDEATAVFHPALHRPAAAAGDWEENDTIVEHNAPRPDPLGPPTGANASTAFQPEETLHDPRARGVLVPDRVPPPPPPRRRR